MFNTHFDIFGVTGLAALLGGVTGWIIIMLPVIIAAVRRPKSAPQVVLLVAAYFVINEVLAWLADGRIENKTIIIVLFIVNFVALWLMALLRAIISPKEGITMETVERTDAEQIPAEEVAAEFAEVPEFVEPPEPTQPED